MRIKKKSDAVKFLEKVTGKELSIASLIESIRLGDDITQSAFAKKLKISKSHLCDIEKGRKFLSVSRAADFAKLLGFSEEQFVRLALQDEISRSGLKFKVKLDRAA
ncbi:MAG: helix-turn-helix transcriptional regulator [Moraxellaceae bacterium]|nr:helix-turn-helix transcriptional regulator [Pseudobdellovibrionaceae bacterium]